MIHKKQKHAGVSSIVGVILMITLTILLASIVSGFAFDLVDDLLQSPAQAGLSFSETYDAQTDQFDVDIVWSSEGTVENIHAIRPNGASTERLTDVGETINVNGLQDGDELRIIGTMDDGSEQVIQTYTVSS